MPTNFNTEEDWDFAQDESRVVHDDLGDHAGSGTIQMGYDVGSLREGLAAYYPINEGEGTVVRDAGLGNIAQINGASWTTDSVIGSNALDISSGDYIEIPKKAAQTVSQGDLSISMWVKADDLSSGSQTVITNYGGSTEHFIFEFGGSTSSDDLSVFLDDGNTGNWHPFNTPISSGVWKHVGFSYSQGSNIVQMFIDGQLVNTDTYAGGTIDFGGRSIAVGVRRNDFSTNPYSGLVDGIRVYNKALSEIEFELIANITSPSGRLVTESNAPGQSEGGVSRYKFDGSLTDSWGTNDASGTTNAGFVTGIYNQAKDFDGGSDYLDTPYDADFGTNAFSVSAWVRFDRTGNYETVAGTYDGSTGWLFRKNSSEQYHFWIDGSNVTGGNIPIGDWTHYVATRNSSGDTYIYKNGKIISSGSLTGNADSSSNMDIGRYPADGNYLDGAVDDLRIYNVELSQNQVESLFNIGSYRIKRDDVL